MALTAEEQKLLDFALASLPDWFTDDEREMESLGASAKVMGAAQTTLVYWFSQAAILTAVGATGSDPDWLNQHAVDLNTTRQALETDVALRERLRTFADALTTPVLLAAAQSIVDAEGVSGTVAMLEVPRDLAYFRTAASDAGTGGTFTAPGVGDVQTFEPDTAFAGVPFREIEEAVTHKLVISGAAVGGNDGTFTITGIDDDAVQFVNAGGGVSVDATVSWTVAKYDRDDNLLDGFQDSFLSRGDRMGNRVNGLIVILPFGSTAGTAASVLEMLRQRRGAGVKALVEYRQIP